MSETLLRETLLRELTDDEFQARYNCDRFTASVLASRFRYIIEHVCNRFIEHAFSPVIRETTDMSATITGPPSIGHAMPAVSQTLPIFYGSMPEAVRIALTEHGVEDWCPATSSSSTTPTGWAPISTTSASSGRHSTTTG